MLLVQCSVSIWSGALQSAVPVMAGPQPEANGPLAPPFFEQYTEPLVYSVNHQPAVSVPASGSKTEKKPSPPTERPVAVRLVFVLSQLAMPLSCMPPNHHCAPPPAKSLPIWPA